MDYNTQREQLILPEYGRHIQKMIEQVKQISDRDKRSEQVKAIVNIMSVLNPHLREFPDYKHKLWDHVEMIAGYDLDVDSPYPLKTKEDASIKPDPIEVKKDQIKAACYGRNIQNMIALIAAREDDDAKKEMIRMLALYMRQQYLIWNKDTVSDETIFNDMEKLSNGLLKVPEGIELGPVSGEFNRPGMILGNKNNFKKGKNKKRKKN